MNKMYKLKYRCIALCVMCILPCIVQCSESDITGDVSIDRSDDLNVDIVGDTEIEYTCDDCDDDDPCTVDTCDPETGECRHDPIDIDGDGFASMTTIDGTLPCPGDDCNDSDSSVYPGAPEVCLDGVDQDCDTVIDGPIAMLSTLHLKSITEDGSFPSLVWTGSEFGILWQEGGILYLARVDDTGVPIGEIIELHDTHEHVSQSSMVWNGSEYAIVYERWEIGSCTTTPIFCPRQIEFIAASEYGDIVIPTVELVDVENRVTSPFLIWNGDLYGILWKDHRDGTCSEYGPCQYEFYYTRLSSYGEELSSEVRITDASGNAVATTNTLNWSGSEFALAWKDVQDTGVDYYFTRFNPDGEVLGEDTVLENPVHVMMWTGSQYGITWDDDASGAWHIYWGSLNPSGELLDGPVQVSDIPDAGAYPEMAVYNNSYAITWLDGRNRDCSPRPYEWLGDCHQDIYLSLIDEVGTTIWEDLRITTSDSWKLWVDIEWTGSDFGVVWSEYYEEPEESWRISFDIIAFCDQDEKACQAPVDPVANALLPVHLWGTWAANERVFGDDESPISVPLNVNLKLNHNFSLGALT